MAQHRTKAVTPQLRFPEFRAEKGWRIQHLGNVCALYQPETISSSSFKEDGRYVIYGAGGIIGRLDRFNHEQAEVIIGCRGICGNASLTQPKSWITGNAMVVRPDTDELSKEFLFHTLDAADLSPVISGSAQPQITRQGLKRFPITVPPPAEQQKIADCLTSLDEVIAAQGRKVEALKAHKRGLMQQLFPREGETRPRVRFPEFRDAPEWTRGNASDIVDVLQGYGFPERLQGSREGEFPFYKVSDISACVDAGDILLGEANNHIDADVLDEIRAKLMPIGSTVFAKIGEAIRSNKRAITSRPCLVDNNAAGVKAIAGLAHDLFVYYLWCQVPLIEYAGGVVPAVNKSAMEKIQVCYPKPDEQQRIADCLASLDTRIHSETARLAALRTHKQGLMQQLFPAPEASGA